MTQRSPSLNQQEPERAIWLVVSHAKGTQPFELLPHSERCITFGSGRNVDVRVEVVTPVVFHLERCGNGATLIPTYVDSDILVDSAPIRGPHLLRERAVVDVAGCRLWMQLCDSPPPSDRGAWTSSSSRDHRQSDTNVKRMPAGATFAGFGSAPDVLPPRQAGTVVMEQPEPKPQPHQGAPVATQFMEPPRRFIEPNPTMDLASQAREQRIVPARTVELSNVAARGHQAIAQQAPRVINVSTVLVSPSAVPRVELPHAGQVSAVPVAAHVPMAPVVPVTQTTVVDMAALKMEAVGSGGSPQLDAGSTPNPLGALPDLRPRYEEVARAASAPPNAACPVPQANATPVRARSNPVQVGGSTPGRGGTPAGIRVASVGEPAVAGVSRSRKPAAPMTAADPSFARLRALAHRYPVGVFGGAAVSVLLFDVFLVGLGQVLGLGKSQARLDVSEHNQTRVTAASSDNALRTVASPTAVNPAAVNASAVATSALPNGPSEAPAPSDPTGSSVAPLPRDAKTANVAVEPDATVGLALGHLFAGRLPEAEHAYRDLLARYPQNSNYARLVRILARRNSADCRPSNPMAKACPTVKP